MLSILVQGARAGKRNRKSSNFVCVNKKEGTGRQQATVTVRRGGERASVQKKPSGIALGATLGKAW